MDGSKLGGPVVGWNLQDSIGKRNGDIGVQRAEYSGQARGGPVQSELKSTLRNALDKLNGQRRSVVKTMGLMRATSIILAVFAASILSPGKAQSWNPATHAYMEESLCRKIRQLDDGELHNRIYGANALDLFNNNFTATSLKFAAYLHDPTQDNFLKVWKAAGSKGEKAFAHGFVSHNNSWGMDSTGHLSGITLGRGEGYVIAKANVLASLLKPLLEEQLGPLSDAVVLDLCHHFIEVGVDFLVRRMDPCIGEKLMAAATYRTDEVPQLLATAFKADFSALAGIPEEDAAPLIVDAEGDFRPSLWLYGAALDLDAEDDALDLVSEGVAKVGAEYLGLPEGWDRALAPTVKQGILVAIMLCSPDIKKELSATTERVNLNLSAHGIFW
ncbi:hypothetical protein [Desulforhabdus sp. TSK]|uniref:hypothetical protein n=1 Tax=Desulforhabdus sp. TSK TaxID=2925014 RepID=UPI001FC81F50|nr:hypothetical protein [Desulforhabdus sp. TSK]